MKWDYIITFKKRMNLMDFYRHDPNRIGTSEAAERYYSEERDVKLVVIERFEAGKIYCTIKCPVNPLPVKGEFEVPGFSVLERFLVANGWKEVSRVSARMIEYGSEGK